MRYIAISIGLAVLLLSAPVSAQTPVSTHYVPSILERANTGIEKAKTDKPATNFTFIFFRWMEEIQSIISSSIDVQNRIILQEQNLENITPCLHHDLLLIESKINEVNDALLEAMAQKRVNSIWQLKQLLQWLNGRYNNLIIGATNPSHVDEAFSWHMSFDKKTWCCNEPRDTNTCVEIERESCFQQGGALFESADECNQVCQRPAEAMVPAPVCPFDTNYLPPTGAGYGCDEIALAAIDTNEGSVAMEAAAFELFAQRKKEFLEEYAEMIPAGDLLFEFAGREPVSLPLEVDEPRAHLRITGCAENTTADTDAIGTLPKGAARIALRSPFSFGKEEARLSITLKNVLQELGKKREQEDDLKLPSAYPAGSPERAAAEQRENRFTVLQKILRQNVRAYFTKTNQEHASEEALPLLQSIDAQQRVEEKFGQLRAPMQELSKMAASQDRGVRKFVANYAGFLRKSCIYRPCNTLLNRILTIVSDDQCFPYVSGAYLTGFEPADCGG